MIRFLTVGLLAAVCALATGHAAEPAAKEPDPAKPKAIQDQQSGVESRYQEFEAVLARVADLLRPNDPDRAAVLAKAFGQSKKDLIVLQLQELLKKFEKGEVGEALKDQEAVLADMKAVMDLLMSEDRAQRLRERRERIEKYLKDVQELADRQKALRSETERAQDSRPDSSSRLSESQGKLAQDTEDLADRIQKDDANDASKDGKPSKSDQDSKDDQHKGEGGKEGKQNDSDPRDEQSPDRKQSPDQKRDSPNSPMPGDKPADGKPGSPSDNKESQESQDQPNDATPGQKNLRSAEKAMQRAKERLQQLKREEASREQDEAIRELEKTIQDLEEVLRQLREEERQELLANIESRLRKILEQQQIVYDATLPIDQVPADKRSRAEEQKTLALSRREAAIVTEMGQVHSLLAEDGTAIAFPETIEQLQSDAQLVADLLGKLQTGALTQSVETDIIDTLKEMIEALQKEMQENKKKKQQQQPSQGGGPGKTPLVEKIAELKMVRSLQHRVNERTVRIEKMIADGQTVDKSLDDAITDLADRQHRIYEITRDIAQGKNQ